jgi:hypothetical protein
MRFDIGLLLDLLSPLALLAILCLSHDLIRQRLPGRRAGEVAMGLSFGLVAAVQMMAPMIPVAGLIVDLRVVPIALAGAYLGWRGVLACLAVALAIRWQIGGIGLVPDALGMVIAGGAGLLWAWLTRHHRPRGMRALMGLAFLMSANVLTGALMPAPFAMWMLTSAAPMLVLFYLVAVPLLAAILEARRTDPRPARLGCNDRAARPYRPPDRPYGTAR